MVYIEKKHVYLLLKEKIQDRAWSTLNDQALFVTVILFSF